MADANWRVICNGIPKSGTHALERAVQLLGCLTQHTHTPYDSSQGRQIVIFRHPKNVLVSWLRHQGIGVTEGHLIGLCKEFRGLPLYDAFAEYTPYLHDKDVLTVRFESLFSDGGETLNRIAQYLDVPVPPDAYGNIVGLTRSYTGKLSNWEDHWSELVESAWVEGRGPEVEAAWNY